MAAQLVKTKRQAVELFLTSALTKKVKIRLPESKANTGRARKCAHTLKPGRGDRNERTICSSSSLKVLKARGRRTNSPASRGREIPEKKVEGRT